MKQPLQVEMEGTFQFRVIVNEKEFSGKDWCPGSLASLFVLDG